jgi:GT2 family glycosyltransferase
MPEELKQPESVLPDVSIVIPMWNKCEETRRYAELAVWSVARHVQTAYELIVVDNASPFPIMGDFMTAAGIKEWTLLKFMGNRGFGPAVNAGAKLARGRYLCQMNSDAELVEDSVSELIRVMREYGLVVAMPENYDACMHYKLQKSNQIMGETWRFGAFWVAVTAVFREVGGFDEGYKYSYWEDTDLWRRIEERGYHVAGWRGTWVKHVGGASSHPDRDRWFAYNKKRYDERWRNTTDEDKADGS